MDIWWPGRPPRSGGVGRPSRHALAASTRSDGAVQERQVRVMAVEPGRVRLRDVVRETELTVAVHRIVSVEAN